MSKLEQAGEDALAAVERSLAGYDRGLFLKEVARLLHDYAPTPAAARTFANRHPDRWAQMVATFARLGGYTDRTESISLNFFMDLRGKSDMEIEHALREEQAKIARMLDEDQKQIEGHAVEVTGDGDGERGS